MNKIMIVINKYLCFERDKLYMLINNNIDIDKINVSKFKMNIH